MELKLRLTIEGADQEETYKEIELLSTWLGWLAYASPIGPVPGCLLRLNEKVKKWLENYKNFHNYPDNRVWNQCPPEGVLAKDHYASFGWFLTYLQNTVYARTERYVPDTLQISPNLWPVVANVAGWEDAPKEQLAVECSPKRVGKLARHNLTVWADASLPPGGLLYYSCGVVRHPDTSIDFKVIDEKPGQGYFPLPDDECPLCKNGTIAFEEGELRCRGECGTIWRKPLSSEWLAHTGELLAKLKPYFDEVNKPSPPLPPGKRNISYYEQEGAFVEPIELTDMVGNKTFLTKETKPVYSTGKAFHKINAANIRKMLETEMAHLTAATATKTIPEIEGQISALLKRILIQARPIPKVTVKEKETGGIEVQFSHPNTDSPMTTEQLYAYLGLT